MPQRARRRGGSRIPWLWLAIIVVVGGAVVAARTLGRPNGVTPRPAEPTLATSPPTRPVIAPTAVSQPAAAPKPQPLKTPTVVSQPAKTPTLVTHPTTLARATQPASTPTVVSGGGGGGSGGGGGGGAEVALTFDAGADRGYAEDILDTLTEQHVVASFGITGLWAKANPDLVRRMAADGHLVFNHTYDHRSFTGVSDSLGGLSAAARRAELDEADAIIAPLIGHSTRPFYRLPYGDDDAHVASDVQADGYTRKIGWTVDSLGWKGLQSADIVSRCVKMEAPGAVYVFHVGRASQDAMALSQVIHLLRDRGFGFRRVDQG